MTLDEFHSKPLVSKTDGTAVVTHASFGDVCAYIADGPDTKVACLLAGLWAARGNFTKDQICKAAICGIFPNKGYMRRTTSSSALMLAKAAGCQHDLQEFIVKRWPVIEERECTELVLGLSDSTDLAEWMPVIATLFELNSSGDVRTQLVRTVANMARATSSPEARDLVSDFLKRMPVSTESYSNPDNPHFLDNLRAKWYQH